MAPARTKPQTKISILMTISTTGALFRLVPLEEVSRQAMKVTMIVVSITPRMARSTGLGIRLIPVIWVCPCSRS